jgi:hypothetical protein
MLEILQACGWTAHPEDVRRSGKHTPNGFITMTMHRRATSSRDEGLGFEGGKLPTLAAFLNANIHASSLNIGKARAQMGEQPSLNNVDRHARFKGNIGNPNLRFPDERPAPLPTPKQKCSFLS